MYLITWNCFLKILEIIVLFPFYHFPIQRPHIWSKAVTPSLNWTVEALNRRGCNSRRHLATLPVRHRGAWQSSPSTLCLVLFPGYPVLGSQAASMCCLAHTLLSLPHSIFQTTLGGRGIHAQKDGNSIR